MLLAPMKPAAPPLLHLDHVNTAGLPLEHVVIPSPILMPPSKRPKLSLQTTSLSGSYGASSNTASNRIENMTAATPTTLNTFNNTFDLTIRPSPNSATASPNVLQRARSNPSTPFRRKAPYDLNLPLGIRSILKNSELFNESRRSSLNTSASPRTSRKVFFPAAKKVSFVPIDEEITTQTYVARHFDLSSSEDDSSSDSSKEREAVVADHDGDIAGASAALTSEQSPSAEDEGRSGRAVRRLASSHRSKRKKRRWEWTIESLDKTEGQALKAQKTDDDDAATKMSEQQDANPTEPAGDEDGVVVDSVRQEASCGLALDEACQPGRSTTPTDDPPQSPWAVM